MIDKNGDWILFSVRRVLKMFDERGELKMTTKILAEYETTGGAEEFLKSKEMKKLMKEEKKANKNPDIVITYEIFTCNYGKKL